MSNKGFERSTSTPKGYSQQPDGRFQLYNQTYLGFVKDNQDALKMGRLKVWIPELSADPNEEARWVTVNYCSPFAGATSPEKLKKDGKKLADTQQTYGWWATPPDVDNEVIILFINGDPNRGIYIGGMYQEYMNHMIPGIPVNKSFDPGEDGRDPPVAEYNKWDTSQNNSDDPIRPRFDPLHEGLKAQGLYNDPIRGTSTSGARRESPSKVFGIKSPSGSHFVMDDNPGNEFIRMRTKSGTQVLIHEDTGFVYINSKNGNSWMQIGDDGIDVYTAKSLNIRTQQDLNIHVDKNFNLHVGKDWNIFVAGNKKESVGKDSDLLVGKSYKMSAAEGLHLLSLTDIKAKSLNYSVTTEGFIAQKSAGPSSYTSDTSLFMKGTSTFSNSSSGPQPVPAEEAAGKEPVDKSDRELNKEEQYPEIDTKSVVSRMPTHEPFDARSSGPTAPVKQPVDLNTSSRVQVDGKAPVPNPKKEDTLPGQEETTPAPAAPSNSSFVMPTSGRVTSSYGPRNTGIPGASTNHKGVDIAAPSGTMVVAAKDGKVTRATTNASGYGTVIYVDHGDGTETRYAHLSKMNVKAGDAVKQGQSIGAVGNTGVGSGPHLHFEIRESGSAIDPSTKLSGLAKGSKTSTTPASKGPTLSV